MLSVLRHFLVVFLVLLQLFAPLVHAHVDAHYASDGIHVPGLEQHVAEPDRPALQALVCVFSSTNVIVGIDTGFSDEDERYKNPADKGNVAYIHQALVIFNTTLSATDSNFSPHPDVVHATSLVTSPYAPRAPPLV